MANEKILVIGGAGYIGSHVVKAPVEAPVFQFYFPALIAFISCVTFFRFVMPLYIKRHTQ